MSGEPDFGPLDEAVQEFSQAVEVFAALCGRRTTLEQDIVRQAIVGVLKAARHLLDAVQAMPPEVREALERIPSPPGPVGLYYPPMPLPERARAAVAFSERWLHRLREPGFWSRTGDDDFFAAVDAMLQVAFDGMPETLRRYADLKDDFETFALLRRGSRNGFAKAESILAACAPQHVPPPRDGEAKQSKAETPSTPEALWKRSGGVWHVRAFGREGHFLDLDGFRYIGVLLSKPNERVPMRELVGIKAGDTPRETVETEPAPQAVMDEQALRELYAELKETQAALEKARIAHNVTECDILEDELQRLQRQVNDATRPGGIPRNFTRSIDKARPSILNALRRAYRQLRDGGLPETARHLEISIRTTGADCIYMPAHPIRWHVVTSDVTK